MNKLLNLLLSSLLVLSLTGCKSNTADSDHSQTQVPTAEVEDTSKEEQLEKDKEELSHIGDIEVENGLLTVSITLPSDFTEGVTQSDLDAQDGTKYVSAKLNDDGSVTYKFTKSQYKEMLQEISNSIEDSLKELVDSNDYSFTEIKHNADYTEFNATIEGSEPSLADSFAVLGFYMYSGIYGIFKGKSPENVIVNFYDTSGNLINTTNSSDLQN